MSSDRSADDLQALDGERLLKVGVAASILNVHRSKVYRLVQDGSLPAVYVGDSIRIRPADLRQFVVDSLRRGPRRHATQVAEDAVSGQEPAIVTGGWRPPTSE